MSESQQVLWVTMESPTRGDIGNVMEELNNTTLGNRYDIVLTDDKISTLDKDELIEVLEDE